MAIHDIDLVPVARELAADLVDVADRHGRGDSFKCELLNWLIQDVSGRLRLFRSQYEPQPAVVVELVEAAAVPAAWVSTIEAGEK